MQALIVVDAQNEFSAHGKRPVPDHDARLAAIRRHAERARHEGRPIAWVRHHNRPGESPAFVPGSWGAELSPGLGPLDRSQAEALFDKDVYGAFTGTGLDDWLRQRGADSLLIVGFYAHMCVSTSVREALVRGWRVAVDPRATGACEVRHPRLGDLSAAEVARTALLHLAHMGAEIVNEEEATGATEARRVRQEATA